MNPAVRMIGLTQPYHDPDYPEPLPLNTPRDLIEYPGRWDYGEGSVAKLGTDPTIIGRWLASGEESMVEMVDAQFLITCSRVVSHELVRHRIASYQQESQRFVKYDEEEQVDLFFLPPEVEAAGPEAVVAFRAAMDEAHTIYLQLKHRGVKSQIARYVLPNATRTRVVAKMNVRAWRHVLGQRMHTSAQPEMRIIAGLIHGKLQRALGADLFPDSLGEERVAR